MCSGNAFFLFTSLALLGHAVAQTIQIGRNVIAVLDNLKSLQLSNASFFDFGPTGKVYSSGMCKPAPGDADWPSPDTWNTLNLLTGGALISTVPLGAACFQGEHYDAVRCAVILERWDDPHLHAEDPTSVMNPLYQGATCMPQNAATGGTCEIGGSASYSVNVSTVSQVQLAVNFARNTGVRLIVHNTGHDYMGKSTGANALSIWTRNLRTIEFIEKYSSSASAWTGSAFKLGAGVQVWELLAAANDKGVSVLTGECPTVGVAGGYIAGGGMGPLSSKYGLAVDHVLSLDVVTPDGNFVTADQKNNADLFWALRGGGGGTFGVVTSVTVRTLPKMKIAGLTLSITIGPNGDVSETLFWEAITGWWRRFPDYVKQGSYAYSIILPTADGGLSWALTPWIVPDMSLDQFKAMTVDLRAEWERIGFNINLDFFETENFYDAWTNHFPSDTVGVPNLRTASRLIPSENWVNPSLLDDTVMFIQRAVRNGSSLIGYNIRAAPVADAPASATVPIWRDTTMFAIVGTMWDATLPNTEVDTINQRITKDWTASLRSLTPGGGTYSNEADVMDPDFQQAFYGYDNYQRLTTIKQAFDPWGLFYAPTGVGSETWSVTDQQGYVLKQTGKLCKK
ncbi:putative 6-hydroxy-D-nicotine oxidase [Periconia macrospinosa]|uniref:Putative 6-hydroxy-D-nicotine oxidase n=1 Tax=Periconia macrospinosa TaxID=97972 RepID=A0A2V1DDT3_9PLEO|nr:putative 6-hydroxy-D-nicotine oxidase [Periconia macrospinosa]